MQVSSKPKMHALVYLGFENIDRPDRPWEKPRYGTESTILHERLTPYWNFKLRAIQETTKVPGDSDSE